MSHRGSRSPHSRKSPPGRRANGVSKDRVAALLRRTKGFLDLRSAFKPSSKNKVKRTTKIFYLRGASVSLKNDNDKRTLRNRNSRSNRTSSGFSSSHYVGVYDPKPDKLQLVMTVDLCFLFCVNRIIIHACADHPLRSVYTAHPKQGIDQIGRLLRIYGLTVKDVHAPDTVDSDLWNVIYNQDVEKFPTTKDYVCCLTSNGQATQTNWMDWNVTGAELISRSLRAPDCDTFGRSVIRSRQADKSLLEIYDYLEVLTNPTSASFIVTRPDTTHVGISIGAGPGEKPLDEHLDLLKHLALLIVEYEDIISLFHHPDRRGWTDAKANTRSHRYGARDKSHVCGTLSVDNILEIEAEIFGCRDIYALVNLMEYQAGDNALVKFINWSNIVDYGVITGKTDTLTFWQHAGSKDILEIGNWIRLIINLFRLAERRSLGIGPPTKPQGLDIDMNRIGEVNRLWVFEAQEQRSDDLLELLGLSRNDRKYWQKRMQEYAKDEYLQRYQTSGFEQCLACEKLAGLPEQQAFPQIPHIQRQLQQETQLLLLPAQTEQGSAIDHAEIERIVADHAALGTQISTFVDRLGLTETKYTKEGGLVCQIFELARDYVQLEAQIEHLQSQLDTLSPYDGALRREIEGILHDDRRLHNEIEVLLKGQPDAETLGEHRLLRDLHELRISHAKLSGAIDTLRAQAALLPQAVRDILAGSVIETPVVAPQTGPHLRKMLNDLLAQHAKMVENHRNIAVGLDQDRTTLTRLEEMERRDGVAREKVQKNREKAGRKENKRKLRETAGELLVEEGERPVTIFESGGPPRRPFTVFANGGPDRNYLI